MQLEWRLTDEQKNRVMRELWDYISIDCYDFAIDVGGLTILAGNMVPPAVEAPRNEDASRRGSR
jgi:hypothetical protein